jgi:hypothetical protein
MVNNVSFIRDTILLLRDIISGTVADPLNDRQRQSGDTGSNARFVMTSFPERAIAYPFITIQDVGMIDASLGMNTQDTSAQLRCQVDVWTKQVGQRDGIAGSVYHGLRTKQLGNSSLLSSGLYNFQLVSSRNLDEEGKGGVHRKSMDFQFRYNHT